MPDLPLPAVATALLLAGTGAAPAAAPGDGFPPPQYQVAQLMIQQRIVVRVQRPATPAATPIVWTERKGPRCIPLDGMAGALIVQPDAVDLVFEGGQRMRARLDKDCPALDFYAGFYLRPTRDGKICADRDSVRSRSGRACEIDSFRKLVAKR